MLPASLVNTPGHAFSTGGSLSETTTSRPSSRCFPELAED